MKKERCLGWINKPLEVCEYENKIFECQQCNDFKYDRKTILARSYAAGIGSPFVLVCSTYRAGYEAGYSDAKEEMSYDVHTCHNDCKRHACVMRRKIESLTRKNEILLKALEFYADSENYWHEPNIKSATSKMTGNVCYDVVLDDFERNFSKGIDMAGKTARQAIKDAEGVG